MKIGWRAALGILLSAVLLWWTLKGVPFGEVLRHLRTANLPLLVLSAVLATGIFPLRARRWRPILAPIAPGLPFGTLWRPTAVGMMISNVVPARAGELARAYALTRETDRVPFSAAFASIAVDRLFDAAMVLALMFGAMLDPAFAPEARVFGRPVTAVARGGLVFALVVFAALYGMVFFPTAVRAVASRVARVGGARLERRVVALLDSFVNGLAVLRDPRRFAEVLWWTLLHWLLNAVAFYVAMRAVGITAPFSASLFLQGLIAIGVALPQAPGFFGAFEALGKAGLGVYGVPEDQAVAWAIGFHFLSFLPITIIGAVYFARLGLSMAEMRRAGASKPAAAAPER